MYLVREDDMYMTSIRVLTFCWPRISVINQLDAQNVCFTISLFHASTCLVHETATYRCDDTTGCLIQFWPPDDEHMWSKYVEAWKEKLTVKQKFCASSWLITEIKNDICITFYPVSVFMYVHKCKNIGIPVSKQHLWLILMEAWWWPVDRSKHIAYILQ